MPSATRAGRFARWVATLMLVALMGAATPDDQNPGIPPLAGDDLTTRAAELFEAVKAGRPELADGFFFPREPFIPLKDVKDPGRYHRDLVSAYHHDIRELHTRRRSWDGAHFRSFKIVERPRRIPPGREWNKIGYFRTRLAKLEYEVSGHLRSFEVHTLISWDGRWYVTHLSPIHR